MSKSFYVLLTLALIATGVAYYKSPALAWKGAESAVRLFLNILPQIMAGFLLGGMVQVLIPRDLVAAYAGDDSGLRGLFIATFAGAVTPGGPFIAFPLVLSLWKAGTGIGPLISYITSWSLLGLHRIIIYEGPIMGWRFVAIRLIAAGLAPIGVGLIAAAVYRRFS